MLLKFLTLLTIAIFSNYWNMKQFKVKRETYVTLYMSSGPVNCDVTATSGIRGWLETKQTASLYFPDAPTSEHFLLALKAIIVFKQFRYCVIRDQRR